MPAGLVSLYDKTNKQTHCLVLGSYGGILLFCRRHRRRFTGQRANGNDLDSGLAITSMASRLGYGASDSHHSFADPSRLLHGLARARSE